MSKTSEIEKFATERAAVRPGFLGKVQRFLARHERAVDIFGGAWFWLSIAVYSRWINLPEIPFLTEAQLVFIAAAWNGIWWGFLRPRIDKLRTEAKAIGEAKSDG